MAIAGIPQVTGLVKSIQVFGLGQNSAEVVVVMDVSGINETFRVGAYPATEASVFTSFVMLLSAAHHTKTKIDLQYLPVTNQTPQVRGIVFPAA